jgi:predicted DNA-binding transcriptional regulator AlpA
MVGMSTTALQIELPADDPDTLLSMKAVAQHLNMTTQSLSNKLTRGDAFPPRVTILRRHYWRSSDIRAYMLGGDSAIADMQPF